MNTILALQKLDTMLSASAFLDSTQSHCCGGSTHSYSNCCND